MATPTPLESEAAHLRALELFRRHFLRRFPGGVVISELEFLAATTIAPRQPRMIQYPGKRAVNKVLQALSQDFRRWNRQFDYRKPDGMGITEDGWDAELIEVTTVGRRAAAETQMRDKLDTLHRTVNRIHGLNTNWKAAPWRPVGPELFYPLPASAAGKLRVISFHPTYRENAPTGIILYEILEAKRKEQPFPVPLPQADEQAAREESRGKTTQTAVAWARQFATEHPSMMGVLRGLALAAGVAMAVAAVLALLDPLPGDEVAAAMAAAALLSYALNGAVGDGLAT